MERRDTQGDEQKLVPGLAASTAMFPVQRDTTTSKFAVSPVLMQGAITIHRSPL